MSDAVDPHLSEPDGPRTISCATELVCRDCGYRHAPARHGLQVSGLRRGARHRLRLRARQRALIAERGLAERPWNIWRFEELLPIVTRRAQQRGRPVRRQNAADPRRAARRRARAQQPLPEGRLDQPPDSLSYKDRVVGMAIARLLELGKDEVGCVSTGNVGTAVAALAAKAGAPPYIFYPGNMEKGKAKACRALGAQVCQLDGNYDQANRACRELAVTTGMEFANITLRPFYAEGAKTMAFEVVEELGWTGAGPLRHPGRRRHPLLARPQGAGRAGDGRPRRDRATRRSTSPRPAAARRSRPRSSAAARSSRRRRRRRPTRWRSAPPATATWSSTRCARAAAPAAAATDDEIFAAIDLLGRDRGHPHRAGRRHDDRLDGEAGPEGKIGPDETVVAVISGNGLKTLHEHPGEALAGNGPLRGRRRWSELLDRLPPGSARPRCTERIAAVPSGRTHSSLFGW